MPKDIIEIDSNTRQRLIGGEWKLEKKHASTGQWCIHPVQFMHDHQHDYEEMWAELDREMETRRQELMTPVGAQAVVDEILKDHELYEDEQGLKVAYVIEATVDWHGMTSREEIVFVGSDGKRYITGTSSYSGSYDEPPDYEDWLEDLDGMIEQIRRHVEKRTAVPAEASRYNGNTRQFEIVKFDTKTKHDAEKRRLEGIYRRSINRLRYLEKFTNICDLCWHRKESKRHAEEQAGHKLICDPAPRVECKRFEMAKLMCTDFRTTPPVEVKKEMPEFDDGIFERSVMPEIPDKDYPL